VKLKCGGSHEDVVKSADDGRVEAVEADAAAVAPEVAEVGHRVRVLRVVSARNTCNFFIRKDGIW